MRRDAKGGWSKVHRFTDEEAMRLIAYAAGLAAAVLVVVAFATPSAEAQQPRKKRYVTSPTRVIVAGRPRARITVAPRSFLDAGTEVLPGERKFTDYAFPPAYFPMGSVTNTGGKVGWDNTPLPQPFDLPSRRNPYGW
jgi:hypothetical protein